MFQRSGAIVVILGTIYGLFDGAKIMKVENLFDPERIASIQKAQAENNFGGLMSAQFEMIMAMMTARANLYKYSVMVLLAGTIIGRL
jgi:hypothetical protein